MKKTVLLLTLLFLLNSCSMDVDLPDYHYEVLPVESFIVPESFTNSGTYEIKLKYKKPSTCYYVDGVYYAKNLNIRTIGIQATVLDQEDCVPGGGELIETSFNFICTESQGSYIFKFYKGEDENGNDIFEEVEIPIAY